DVGDAEEDETAVVCFHPLGFVQHSLGRPGFRVDGAHSFCLTAVSTAAMVSANFSSICRSSSSVLVYAGARTTSSPANPSGVEWVELTSNPCSNATSSTSVAASSSCGKNDLPSRGSTSDTPSRNPRPRISSKQTRNPYFSRRSASPCQKLSGGE